MPGWHVTMLYLLMWFWGFEFRSICFHSKFFNPLSPVSSPSAPTFCQGISKDEEEGKLWPVHSTLVSVTLCLLSSLLPQQTFSGMYPKYVYTRLFLSRELNPQCHTCWVNTRVFTAELPTPVLWNRFTVSYITERTSWWYLLKAKFYFDSA